MANSKTWTSVQLGILLGQSSVVMEGLASGDGEGRDLSNSDHPKQTAMECNSCFTLLLENPYQGPHVGSNEEGEEN